MDNGSRVSIRPSGSLEAGCGFAGSFAAGWLLLSALGQSLGVMR
jgi:hypothetical protein